MLYWFLVQQPAGAERQPFMQQSFWIWNEHGIALAIGILFAVGCAVINAGRWLRKRVRDA